jgi:hypothetical protein
MVDDGRFLGGVDGGSVAAKPLYPRPVEVLIPVAEERYGDDENGQPEEGHGGYDAAKRW